MAGPCRHAFPASQPAAISRSEHAMGTFKAVVVDKGEQGYSCEIRDFDDGQLMEGDVTVRVTHSTVNYKDGLALTGKAPVVRRFPMIPGIDFAGTVESSLRSTISAAPRSLR